MAALIARLRPAAGRAAELAGVLARRLTAAPGLAGAALVSIGLGQIYRPLLFIAAGAFLLLVDRRLP